MADAVTACIRGLVERGVTQLDQLEALLGLAADPGRVWGTAVLARVARIDAARAAAALDGLARAGLVVRALDTPGDAYTLDRDVDVGALIALRDMHARDRVRVLNTLYACSIDSLRDSMRRERSRRTG